MDPTGHWAAEGGSGPLDPPPASYAAGNGKGISPSPVEGVYGERRKLPQRGPGRKTDFGAF